MVIEDVVSTAHARLVDELAEFNSAMEATGKTCPKSGKPMRHKVKTPGKDGKGGYDFWGGSGVFYRTIFMRCKGHIFLLSCLEQFHFEIALVTARAGTSREAVSAIYLRC